MPFDAKIILFWFPYETLIVRIGELVNVYVGVQPEYKLSESGCLG